MMDLKLWLSILMVCGMSESQISGTDWLITVPSAIPVIQGSCVVIPCVYSHPKTDKTLNRFRAFWFKGQMVVASNIPSMRLIPEFDNRTRVIGNIQSGNCTWQLDGVRLRDAGLFYFRIEISQLFRFAYLNNKVTLNVLQDPTPPVMTIEVSNKVTATCKVTHACPTSPPKITWNRSGMWKVTTKLENTWMWSTTSTNTFFPEEADFNKHVYCTVKFLGWMITKGSVLVSKNENPVMKN